MYRKGDGGGHKREGPHLHGRAWAPGSSRLGWEGEMTVPSHTQNRKGEGQPGRDLGSLWDGMGWGRRRFENGAGEKGVAWSRKPV